MTVAFEGKPEWVADGGRTDGDGLLMLLLLDDAGIILGASPKTAVHQQLMQIDKRRNRNVHHKQITLLLPDEFMASNIAHVG
jgi:hypothetical protein